MSEIEQPLLDGNADIMDRNDQINKIMSTFSETYARRRVVDTLLAIVIAILLGLSVFVVIDADNSNNKMSRFEQHEIQLECSQIHNSNMFVLCQHVGLPQKIGANK